MINGKINETFQIIEHLLNKKEDHEKILQYLKNRENEIQKGLFEQKYENLIGEKCLLDLSKKDIVFVDLVKTDNYQEMIKIFNTMIFNATAKINPIYSKTHHTFFYKTKENNNDVKSIAINQNILIEEIKIISPKVVILCDEFIAKNIIFQDFNWENNKGEFFNNFPLYTTMNSCYNLIDIEDQVKIKLEMWKQLEKISEKIMEVAPPPILTD